MCDGPCSKKILLLLNGLFMLCGLGLLGIGLWMMLDPMFSKYLHIVDVAASNSLIDVAAIVFIAVGGAAFGLALIGCCGALKESQCLIFMYIVFLFLLVTGEIVGAVLALVYRTQVEAHLEEKMGEQLKDHYLPSNEKTYDAWNFLQTELKCCGAMNYSDYADSKWANETKQNGSMVAATVPDSCCVQKEGEDGKEMPTDRAMCNSDASQGKTTSDYLYTTGCHDKLMMWFKNHSLILMCLGFGIAAVQLLGFVAACCFRRAMRTDNYVTKDV